MTRTPNWWDELPTAPADTQGKTVETREDQVLRAGDALSIAVTLQQRDPAAEVSVGAALATALGHLRRIPAGDPAGIRRVLALLDEVDRESVEPPARSHLRRAEESLARALTSG